MTRGKLSVEEQLAKIAQQEQKIADKKKALKAKLSTQQRKDDTRQKILVGAAVLAEMLEQGKGSEFTKTVAHVLEKRITKERDRQLLRLPERKR